MMKWMLLMLIIACAGCVAVPRVHVTMGTERDGVEYRMDVEY
jgi:hypothetical protein